MASLMLQCDVKGLSFNTVGAQSRAARCSPSSSSTSASLHKLLPAYRPLKQTPPTKQGHPVLFAAATSSNVTHGTEEETWDPETYRALLRGGEDVASVMKTMTEVLEDIQGLDPEEEGMALQMAATGAVQQKLDSLDGSFLLALDWMIREAETEQDEKRKEVLEVIKETVLGQLSEKCPPHVQVIGTLCRTPTKEKRIEILRRSAGGGGVFDTESGGKLQIPYANLLNISTQADNLIAGMEEKRRIKDRRLLAKLVIIREEARNMLGGGLQDERNDNRGFKNIPGNMVKFISKIVSVRPGPDLRKTISNVMNGKEEGEDPPEDMEEAAEENPRLQKRASTHKRKGLSKSGREEVPVRPGMFLESITKILGGMYKTNTAGVGVQQLEWIHRETLKILEDTGFS